MTEYDDGYDDDEQEPNMDAFNKIMETYIIPRLDEVLQDIIDEGYTESQIAEELKTRLFTETVLKELADNGIDIDDCDGIEMNIYSMPIDEKCELIDQIEGAESNEDMAQIISDAIKEKDRYITYKSDTDILSLNTYNLKDKLSPDDVEPISEDQFKEMFGGDDEN